MPYSKNAKIVMVIGAWSIFMIGTWLVYAVIGKFFEVFVVLSIASFGGTMVCIGKFMKGREHIQEDAENGVVNVNSEYPQEYYIYSQYPTYAASSKDTIYATCLDQNVYAVPLDQNYISSHPSTFNHSV